MNLPCNTTSAFLPSGVSRRPGFRRSAYATSTLLGVWSLFALAQSVNALATGVSADTSAASNRLL